MSAHMTEPGRRSPRVLHLVASRGLYGVERMLLGLLPALRELGCDVELASLNADGTGGTALVRALSAAGVPVHYSTVPGRFSLKGIARIAATIRRVRPDIVHVHGYKATILAGPVAVLQGIPTMGTLHTEATKTADRPGYVRIENHVIRRLHGMVAVSEPIRRELEDRGVAPDRIRVIPNGIPDPAPDLEPGDGRPSSGRPDPALLFTGRLIEGKNVDLLIDAVHALRTEFPALCLRVAGEGPQRAALEKRVRKLGLDGSVRFLGFVDDVHDLLRDCTCFVLPSRSEGMPIALLEAMAAGAPIVATSVGSIPSVASHGREAILVDPDSLEGLVDALRHVLRDETKRAALGKRARERFVSGFTAQVMASRYLDFYDSLVGRVRVQV